MSASERLRELESRDSLGNKFQTYPQQQALYAALPLIADVVEAAERETGMEEDTEEARMRQVPRLRAALIALSDALEEK